MILYLVALSSINTKTTQLKFSYFDFVLFSVGIPDVPVTIEEGFFTFKYLIANLKTVIPNFNLTKENYIKFLYKLEKRGLIQFQKITENKPTLFLMLTEIGKSTYEFTIKSNADPKFFNLEKELSDVYWS